MAGYQKIAEQKQSLLLAGEGGVMDFLTLIVLAIQIVKTIARMGDDDTN